MFEDVRPLVLHHGFQVPDDRPSTPQLEDFHLSGMDVVFTFRTEDGVKIPLTEFPEVIGAVRELQQRCREGESISPQLGCSHSPGFSASGMGFPPITDIELHAVSPEGGDDQVGSYRLFTAFHVGEESYRSGMGGDGEYHHFLLGELVVDAARALELVQFLMNLRVLRRLRIDGIGVGHQVSALKQTHSLDYTSTRRARHDLLVEHGLDDASIKRRREELFRQHSLLDGQIDGRVLELRTEQGIDAHTIEARTLRVTQLLDEQRTSSVSEEDPVKALIEHAAMIRMEDTNPQG